MFSYWKTCSVVRNTSSILDAGTFLRINWNKILQPPSMRLITSCRKRLLIEGFYLMSLLRLNCLWMMNSERLSYSRAGQPYLIVMQQDSMRLVSFGLVSKNTAREEITEYFYSSSQNWGPSKQQLAFRLLLILSLNSGSWMWFNPMWVQDGQLLCVFLSSSATLLRLSGISFISILAVSIINFIIKYDSKIIYLIST